MLTRRESRLSQLMIFLQVFISILLFLFIHILYPKPEVNIYHKVFFVSQIAIIWCYLFHKFGLGVIFRSTDFFPLISGYLVTITIAGLALFIELRLLLLFNHHSYSAYYLLLFCIVDLIFLILFKVVFYSSMRYLRRKGHNSRNVIIIGDINSVPFIQEFIKNKDWGYNIHQIITPDSSFKDSYTNVVVVEKHEELIKNITLKGIDDIFYCLPITDKQYNIEQIIHDAEEIGVTVHIKQNESLDDKSLKFKFLNQPSDQPTFKTHRTTSNRYRGLKIKELFDITLSPIILLLLSPFLLLIAIALKIEDGGPVFFKQERVGLNGRRFNCLKFRSMVPNAEAMISELIDKNESNGPTFKIKNDPRITRVGRILRKTSLDEIPQFFNVMKGEMSIVGPRPPLLKEVKEYERSQIRRLSMRPGITCIWQVSGRNELSFEQWMDMDLQYIDNWSLWLDFKLILKTIGVVFKANGQ